MPKERKPGPKVAGHKGHFGRHGLHKGGHAGDRHAPRRERTDQAGSKAFSADVPRARGAPPSNKGGEAARAGSAQKTRQNNGRLWLYGTHAVKAALANPKRKIHRILATERTQELLPPRVSAETAYARRDLAAVAPGVGPSGHRACSATPCPT